MQCALQYQVWRKVLQGVEFDMKDYWEEIAPTHLQNGKVTTLERQRTGAIANVMADRFKPKHISNTNDTVSL